MSDQNLPPQDFVTALESLKGQKFRPEFHLTQIPPPTRIAPWAVALQAEINEDAHCDPDFYRGNTKFVVLYDPQGQPAWDGQFRVVIHAQAPIESELGDDPLLGEVAWSWIHDSLRAANSSFHNLNGTVTRVFNETFGGQTLDLSRIELELRASWTPNSPNLTAHLRAWADFAATLAGLPPYNPLLYSLPQRIGTI